MDYREMAQHVKEASFLLAALSREQKDQARFRLRYQGGDLSQHYLRMFLVNTR